ncbi:MAG: chorismate mutase [Gemmatimonadota bacterium]|nr:chorismate mutase [Gemmatimonadota bacterium]MDE3128753.1 chorismate mutase [Gemmatimonadota bacterium]MDE3174255.1 chorismate mutase [Gemmatimonadota bacterium]MDE3217147.1 chorismate mutase [Gemmatimonadota bacterium]
MSPSQSGSEPPGDAELHDALAKLRSQIEQIDQLIVRLVARRVQLARDTGVVKRAAGMPAVDPDREQAVLQRVGELARTEGVSDADVRRLFALVIEFARAAQTESD